MPKPAIGVYSRPKTTIWWWRIKAPKDLRSLYSSVWAHRCSLGTSSLSDANRNAARLRADWLERFDRQRKGTEVVKLLTPEHGRAIGYEALKVLLADEKTRVNERDRRYMLNPLKLMGIPGMQGYATDLGLSFDENTPGASEAFAHYFDTVATQLRAVVAELPPAPVAPAKTYRLRDVFDKWKESVGVGLRPATVRARELALGLYETATGNPPLPDVSRAMGTDFRTWLLKQEGSRKTAHDRFVYVKSLFSYASTELEWIPRHPWQGLDIEYSTEKPRTAWTAEQIKAFFSLPLFSSYALPQRAKRAGADAAYWIPLLGLYSGAREAELCQLHAGNVMQEQGIWVLDINDDDGKLLKTPASKRKIPIHSELIRLGLLEYAEAMRDAGHVSLWPHLHLTPGKPSLGFSRWFNTGPRMAVANMVIPDFHSFRHAVRSAMSEAEVPEPDIDNIIGHTVKGSIGASLYRRVSLGQLQRGVEKIAYPSLSLERTYKGPAKAGGR